MFLCSFKQVLVLLILLSTKIHSFHWYLKSSIPAPSLTSSHYSTRNFNENPFLFFLNTKKIRCGRVTELCPVNYGQLWNKSHVVLALKISHTIFQLQVEGPWNKSGFLNHHKEKSHQLAPSDCTSHEWELSFYWVKPLSIQGLVVSTHVDTQQIGHPVLFLSCHSLAYKFTQWIYFLIYC